MSYAAGDSHAATTYINAITVTTSIASFAVVAKSQMLLGRKPSGDERVGAGLSSFAAVLAGHHRGMRQVWLADLVGDPDSGLVLTSWQRRRMAAGFVVAALRLRAHDLLGHLWRPVDWALATDQRRNGFITATVGAQAVYIVRDGGLPALISEVWEPCGIAGAALYVLSHWLRRVRGIELAAQRERE